MENDVHDEEGQGRKFVATEDLVQQVNKVVKKQRFTTSEFCVELFEVSRSSSR